MQVDRTGPPIRFPPVRCGPVTTEPDPSPEAREHALLVALGELPALHRRLRASDDVRDLLTRAADAARELTPFDRAVILTVHNGSLTADLTGALADADSDELRRRVRAQPVPLEPGSPEAELVRRPGNPPSAPGKRRGRLAEQLGLGEHVLAAVAPEGRALGVVVLDRAGPAVTTFDLALSAAFSHAVAIALEVVVMRSRAEDLSAELRQSAGLARALAQELLEAPIALPSERGFRSPFTGLDGADGASDIAELLTPREVRIAELLADGRSNREIASELVLSVETVKTHVARILRKLGAGNRVEAATRFTRFRHGIE